MPINNTGAASGASSGAPDGTTPSVATVQVGDVTISDVANRLKVDTDALLQANPQIKDVHQRLSAGQELSLPQIISKRK